MLAAPILLSSPPKNTRWFIKRLNAVSPGNLRLLQLPHSTDTTSNILKPDGRTWTYGNPGGLVTAPLTAAGDLASWAEYSGTGGASITSDATLSLFGTGVVIAATGTGGEFHGRAFTSASLTATTVYTLSAYVKAGGSNHVLLIERNDAANHGKWFNLATGAAGTTVGSIDSSSITSLGSGIFRVAITFTRTNTAAGLVGIEPSAADNARVYVPAGESVYVNAVRLESGSTATAFGANVTSQGNGALVSFDGVNQYLSTPDTADLSVTSGGLTVVSLDNVTDTAAARVLLAKWNATATAREYALVVDASDKTSMVLYDESADVTASNTADAAGTMGALVLRAASVSNVAGGATAGAGIAIYQNGVQVASTAAEDLSFVGTEDTAAIVTAGAYGDVASPLTGKGGLKAIYAANLSAAQHARIAQLCREYYEVPLT